MTAKTEKPDPAIIKRYRREVSVRLTDHEVEVYGRKLAAKKQERDTLTDKAKQIATNFKGQIADATSEVNRLAQAINDEHELRSTEVYDKLEGSQVKTYRADTHELIDQRPAGFADEQTSMFDDHDKEAEEKPPGDFAEPPKADKKAKKPRKKKTVN